ncbi:MAG: hypothetical protein ACRCU5_05455 [Rhizobiaceae bacterium]
MFGLFGVTKDANLAHGYLVNFVEFFFQSVALFGFDKGAEAISSSQWAAGPQAQLDRGYTSVNFRLSIPFETFYASITNEVGLVGKPSETDAVLRISAAEKFLGFSLNAYTEDNLIQVAAVNPIQGKATARAAMLMSRFKVRGATDISNILKGIY